MHTKSAKKQGPDYKKILRLSYDVIITYDNRKLLSHRKIIVRFSCNQAPAFLPTLYA